MSINRDIINKKLLAIENKRLLLSIDENIVNKKLSITKNKKSLVIVDKKILTLVDILLAIKDKILLILLKKVAFARANFLY